MLCCCSVQGCALHRTDVIHSEAHYEWGRQAVLPHHCTCLCCSGAAATLPPALVKRADSSSTLNRRGCKARLLASRPQADASTLVAPANPPAASMAAACSSAAQRYVHSTAENRCTSCKPATVLLSAPRSLSPISARKRSSRRQQPASCSSRGPWAAARRTQLLLPLPPPAARRRLSPAAALADEQQQGEQRRQPVKRMEFV